VEVYLPRGEWIDAWTGEMHLGPVVVKRRAPLGEIPVYLRPHRATDLLPLFRESLPSYEEDLLVKN
jgi:alpha-glucosidase (family GH31 glycosyl hydrolase)